jgi:hypothetical protein
MTDAELRAKFDDNARGFLDASRRDELTAQVLRLETLSDAGSLLDLTISAAIAPQ